MMYKLLNFFHHCDRLWQQVSVGCLLVAVGCQGVHAHLVFPSPEPSRKPLVVLGSVASGKNDTVAAWLGTEFTSFDEGAPFMDSPVTVVTPGAKQKIKVKFGKPFPRKKPGVFEKGPEPTTFYDHTDLPVPLHNVCGFGKRGSSRFFQDDVHTPAARAGLQQILQKPIRGFVLNVDHKHVKDCRRRPSLDVMDFLLPYFEDAAAVTKYLGPSVCLVITGFGGGGWGSVTKRKERACHALRESMLTCYSLFYEAKEGTEDYATLAKQKAFYDALLKRVNGIKPDALDLDDFELNLAKVILFDPKASLGSLGVGDSARADTSVLDEAVATFKGISPMTVPEENDDANWLWAVPAVGASVYAWSSSQSFTDGATGRTKKTSHSLRVSVRKDDDDTDDAVPEPPTSQAPQPPQTSQTPVDDVT